MKTLDHLWKTAILVLCGDLLFCAICSGAEQKPFRDEAQLIIYAAGKEIGREKFSIQTSGNSARSSSSLNFRDPANSKQSVKLETELEMDGSLVPKTYQLRTEVNGQKGIVRGTFADRQATFEYAATGVPPGKTVLLVGDRFAILDTNVFHHFIFIARLFDFESKEKSQPIEILTPQELRNGLLQVSDAGVEDVSVKGKMRELRHLKVDSGSVQVDLWVDAQRMLHKIALPLKRIEVVRD